MAELPYPEPLLHDSDIVLRPWIRDDVPAIVAACAEPSIAAWSPVIPFPYTEADAIDWLDAQEPMRLAGAGIDLAVTAADTDAVLGAVGVGRVDSTLRSGSIGYWLVAEARGHGHMTAAVRLLCRWSFDALGLARLELTTDPHNVASQAVAERCGFQREGHLRSHMRIRHSGRRRDSLIYGLLPDELR